MCRNRRPKWNRLRVARAISSEKMRVQTTACCSVGSTAKTVINGATLVFRLLFVILTALPAMIETAPTNGHAALRTVVDNDVPLWMRACDAPTGQCHFDSENITHSHVVVKQGELPAHGRWNRGSRGSSCSPNFWHGRAGHSSCSAKSLSLLHCGVRLSRIDLDILEFAALWNVQEPKSFQLRPSGPPPRALPLDPAGGSAPRSPL